MAWRLALDVWLCGRGTNFAHLSPSYAEVFISSHCMRILHGWIQRHMVLGIGNACMQTSGWEHCGAERLWHLAMIPPFAYGCGGYLWDFLLCRYSACRAIYSLSNGNALVWLASENGSYLAGILGLLSFDVFFASLAGFYTGAALLGKG